MPSWTRRLDDLSRRWTRALAMVGLLGLLAQSILTIFDILLRALFSAPIHGISDMYELVVIFMVAASFPASLAGRYHITIRVMGKVVHWRVREGLELLGHTLTLLVFVAMGWQLVLHTQSMFETGQTTWLLGIPMGPSWAVATTLIALCTPVQAGVVAIQAMRLTSAREPRPGDPGSVQEETEVLNADHYEAGAV